MTLRTPKKQPHIVQLENEVDDLPKMASHLPDEIQSYPDRPGEWLVGHDDGLGDNEQKRARVLE